MHHPLTRVDHRRPRLLAALAFAGLWLVAATVRAQPFGTWLSLTGPTDGYLLVPDSAALSPTSAFTIEAWVAIHDVNPGNLCSSIIGKNWFQNYWLGVCGTTLRSFSRGGGQNFDAGTVPASGWTHVALVYNGNKSFHYINGELVGSHNDPGGPTPNNAELRIGSDILFPHTPSGAIDEVRLWRVARTQDQIRATINLHLGAPQQGLVAVWSLDGVNDPVGGHNGSLHGGAGFLGFPVGPGCVGSSTQACVQGGRFGITATFRTADAPGPTDGTAKVVASGSESAVFWFFAASNWELMAKALNGCGIDNRYWVYNAGLTDRFFRLQVFDYHALQNKVYFNYPGAPAPAITDSAAFATCP